MYDLAIAVAPELELHEAVELAVEDDDVPCEWEAAVNTEGAKRPRLPLAKGLVLD